jgi:hypothetical protein
MHKNTFTYMSNENPKLEKNNLLSPIDPSRVSVIDRTEAQVPTIESITRAFILQKDHPPGNDSHISKFFGAFLELMNNKNTVAFLTDVIHKKQHEGTSTSSPHFAVLLLRAYQYMQLYLLGKYENIDYIDKLKDQQDWLKSISTILNDELSRETLSELLTTKEVVTNIPSRYAPISAILHAIYSPNDPLKIIDFGCSAHQGVKMMRLVSEGKAQFEPIIDHTPNNFISSHMNQPYTIEMGYGLDKRTFDEKKELEWLLACSHYPKDIKQLPATKKRIHELEKVTRTPIIVTDIYNINLAFAPNSAHAGIFSSMLYEIPERNSVIQKAYDIVDLLFIQDTAIKTSEGLNFHGNIGGERPYGLFLYGKGTNNQLLEVARYKNNRCTEVYPGQDFAVFMRKFGKK